MLKIRDKMENFMSVVPIDVTRVIAQQLDIKSFSKFLTTCKFANENTTDIFGTKVFNNTEKILKGIISSIKDYDTFVNDKTNKYNFTQIICKTYLHHLVNGDNNEDREYLSLLSEELMYNINEEIDATLQDVHIVCNQIINNSDFEEQLSQEIIGCIQKQLFTKEYNVIFELVNDDNEVTYKFIFNITLNNEIPLLKVMIIDEEKEIDLCDNEHTETINEYIKDVEITCDGEVQFEATEENVNGFVKYICTVFGNGVFSNKLANDNVDIHICNFINQPFKCCEFYRELVNDMQITKDISKKIVIKLSSF
jgi:hypothetical protein